MKHKVVLAYINYELRIYLYRIEREVANMIENRKIATIDLIANYRNESEIEDLCAKVSNTLERMNQNNVGIDEKIYCIVDEEVLAQSELANESQSTNMLNSYGRKTEVTTDLLTQVMTNALSKSTKRDGKKYGGFLVHEFVVDSKECIAPVGYQVLDYLEAKGTQHYIDSRLYELFEAMIYNTRFTIKNVFVGDKLYRDAINLGDEEGLIEVGRKSTKFIINHSGVISVLNTKIGLVNFFNQTFEFLKKNYSKEKSLEAVNFLKEHFTINKYEGDYLINDEITLNETINIFRNVLADYFTNFTKKLGQTNQNANKYYLNVLGYDNSELANLINEKTEIRCSPYSRRDLLKTKELISENRSKTLEEEELKVHLIMQKVAKNHYWETK